MEYKTESNIHNRTSEKSTQQGPLTILARGPQSFTQEGPESEFLKGQGKKTTKFKR